MPKTINIKPPLAGIIRSTNFQGQPPFSLAEALNFLPFDAFSGRSVMATRPLLNAWDTPGNAGDLGVNFLLKINGTSNETPQRTLLAGVNGVLTRWDGSASFTTVGGSGSFPTNRAVFGTAYLAQAILCVDTLAPLVYDYPTDTLSTLTATAGTVPLDTRVAATWNNCLWLAGNLAEPHVISCSRTNVITDFDFTAGVDDTAGAFSVTSDSEGLIGEPVTALIPQSDDVLIVGGQDSMWAFRGHPRRGGIFDLISNSIGIMGQGAWTKTPDNILYFLGLGGMYALPPGPGSVPTRISKAIPNELVGLTYNMYDPLVSMEYDSRWHGIHITVRGIQQQGWWYDLTTGSFWGLQYNNYPTVITRFDPIETGRRSSVIYGGKGFGGLASWDLDTSSESGWSFGGKLGPMRISAKMLDKGVIQSASFAASVANADTDIDFVFYTGATGEDAYGRAQSKETGFAYAITSGTLISNGWRCYPRLSGHAFVLDIISGDSESARFCFDELSLEVEPQGRARMTPTHVIAEIPAGGGLIGIGNACAAASHGAGAVLSSTPSWTGYATHTLPIAQATDYTTDLTYLIDLSTMPAAWWTAVETSGASIRVTDSHNIELARDLVSITHGSSIGVLAVRIPQCFNQTLLRIWAGNSGASAPAAGATYGQNNAYTALRFWPDGIGTDRTSAGGVLSGGGAVAGDVTGPFSYLNGTDFEAVSTSLTTITTEVLSPTITANNASFMYYFRCPKRPISVVGENPILGGTLQIRRVAGDDRRRHQQLMQARNGQSILNLDNSITNLGSTSFSISTSEAFEGFFDPTLPLRPLTWEHFGGTIDATANLNELRTHHGGEQEGTLSETATDFSGIVNDRIELQIVADEAQWSNFPLNFYYSSVWLYPFTVPESFMQNQRDMHDPNFYGTWRWVT